MFTYFKLYENYYNNLIDAQNIVSLSKKLGSTCLNYKNLINNVFNSLSVSSWNEKAKPIIDNQIVSGIIKKLDNLSNLINTNLVMACELSINSLLPKLETTKGKDIFLTELNNSLNTYQSNFESLKKNCPNIKITDKVTNTLIDNPEYLIWKDEINVLGAKINDTQEEIKKTIDEIELLCSECNNLIASILALNGNLTESEINSIIPSYSSNAFTFIDVNSYLENLISNIQLPLTIEEILNDTKLENPLLPFVINERKIEITKDGGIRFSFTYKNNDDTLDGIVLLPPNITKNNKDIFAFYSGSGGIYIETLNKEFHDTNPPYPMIAFGRNNANGGMYNEEIQDSNKIETTTSAINAFKEYLGNNNTKVHAIGHSMGAIELNQIVADKPNYFESATFINGRMRFLELEPGNIERESRIHSYENTSTKLNAFISTNDKNVPLNEQMTSYTEGVNININYHNIPYDKTTQKVRFGDNKIANYNNIMFDKIENGMPDYLLKDYGSVSNKSSNNNTTMDIYFLEDAPHTGFLPSCFPNPEFYNLIINNTKS